MINLYENFLILTIKIKNFFSKFLIKSNKKVEKLFQYDYFIIYDDQQTIFYVFNTHY